MRTYLSSMTGNEYRLEKGVVMVNYAHYEGDKFCESQLTRESFNHRVAGKHWSLMSEPTAIQYYKGTVSHRLYRDKAGVMGVFLNGSWSGVCPGASSNDYGYLPVASADAYMQEVDSVLSPYSVQDLNNAFGEVKPEVVVPDVVMETQPIPLPDHVLEGIRSPDPEPTPPPTLHLNRNMAAIIATQPPTAGYAPVNHSEINFNF